MSNANHNRPFLENFFLSILLKYIMLQKVSRYIINYGKLYCFIYWKIKILKNFFKSIANRKEF